MDPTAPRSRRPGSWGLVAGCALAVALSLHLVAIALTLLDLDSAEYGEGPLLAFLVRSQREAPGAGWFTHVPITTNAYGPLFFWLWGGLLRLLPGHDPLLLGRILASACAGAIALVAALAIFSRTRSLMYAAMPALGFVAAFRGSSWLSYARVDTMASCLVALAYVAMGASRRRLLLAACLIALASTAKQTAGLHAIALVAVAWATYGAGRARALAIGVAAAGLALWIPIWTLNQHYFWRAAIDVHITPWNVRAGSGLVYDYLVTPLAVSAMYAAWFRTVERQHVVLRDRWTVGFACSLAAAAVLCMKPGSTVAYFMDASWLGAVLIALQAWRYEHVHPAFVRAGVALAACVLSVPVVHDLRRLSLHPTDVRRQLVRHAAQQGDVIADGYLVPYVVEAGGRLLVSDPFLFTRLVNNGRLSDAEVASRLSGNATAILFRPLDWHRSFAEFWPPSVLDILERDYCLASSEREVFVYRPRWTEECGESFTR